MSYSYTKVKEVIAHTKDIKEVISKGDSYTEVLKLNSSAIDYSKFKLYDGIPVHNGLFELMSQLHTEIPSIEFAMEKGGNSVDIDVSVDPTIRYYIRIRCEAHVYLPNDEYTLGRVGFGDFCATKAKNNNRTPSYMVASHRISNKKYDEYRDQYNMVMTKNLSTAVDSAKKYLRQYAPQDLVKIVKSKVVESVGSFVYKKRRASDEAQDKLATDATVKELKNLISSGYTFLHAEVEQYIKDAIAKYDEYEIYRVKNITGKFVSVSEQLGIQMFDVIQMDGKDEVAVNGTRYRGDEMPEDLMGRVAVLSMAQTEGYIEGVGNRLGDTIFWVQDEA
jgi:predicted RNase H-like HicB family nuclease